MPRTATLHPVTVPGRKSDLEFVRHQEEQLSMAMRLELESNRLALPNAEAEKQVIVTNFIVIAQRLFLPCAVRRARDGEYVSYR
jgi:hypothetical protein